MRQKHYYYFENTITKKMKSGKLNKDNWEVLRLDEVEGPFSIEKSKENYESNCMKQEAYRKVALVILECLKQFGFVDKTILSCGVGKGILEWHLKREWPELKIVCTDYTKEAIEHLKNVFTDMDNAYTFDIINGDYTTLDKDAVILMHRVSTEFSRKEWDRIFKKMYDAGVSNIMFIPTGLDTMRTMLREQYWHIQNLLHFRKDTFCGWLYSEDEFLNIFRGKAKEPLYKIVKKYDMEDTAAYFLERNTIINSNV